MTLGITTTAPMRHLVVTYKAPARHQKAFSFAQNEVFPKLNRNQFFILHFAIPGSTEREAKLDVRSHI